MADVDRERQYEINRLCLKLVEIGEERGKLKAELSRLEEQQYKIQATLSVLYRTATTTKEYYMTETKGMPWDDDNCCAETEHDMDIKSVQPVDGETDVIDIGCRKCGRSGSVQIKPEDINW